MPFSVNKRHQSWQLELLVNYDMQGYYSTAPSTVSRVKTCHPKTAVCILQFHEVARATVIPMKFLWFYRKTAESLILSAL